MTDNLTDLITISDPTLIDYATKVHNLAIIGFWLAIIVGILIISWGIYLFSRRVHK